MLFFEMKGKLTNCIAFGIWPWPHIAGRQLPFPMPNSCSAYVWKWDKSKSRVSSYCLELKTWRTSTQVLRRSAKMMRSTHSIYEFLVFFLAIRQLQNDEFPLHCRLLLGPSEVQNLCIITKRILIFPREFHDLLYKSVLRATITYML